MTTVDIAASLSYGWVRGANASFTVAQSTSELSATNAIIVGVASPDLRIYRAFLEFDTSIIGVDKTVTQANIKMAFSTIYTNPGCDHQIVKYDWSGQDPIAAGNREAAYDGCLAADADDSILVNTVGKAINTYYTSGNLATDWINKIGFTYYGLRTNLDYGQSDWTFNSNRDIFYAPGHATYPPVLTVTYTEAGGLHRINMNAQMQSLNGGMHG